MLKRKIAVIKSNIVTIHNKFESMLKGARPSESVQQSSLSFSRTDDRRQVSKQMISTSPAGNVHYNCWKQIPFSSIASQVSQYSSLQTVVV